MRDSLAISHIWSNAAIAHALLGRHQTWRATPSHFIHPISKSINNNLHSWIEKGKTLGMRTISFCFLVTLALVNAGCGFHANKHLWNNASRKGEVPSLKLAFKEACDQEGALRVLMVHGMSNHPFGAETSFAHPLPLNRAPGSSGTGYGLVTDSGAKSTLYQTLERRLTDRPWQQQPLAFRQQIIRTVADVQFSKCIAELAHSLGCHVDKTNFADPQESDFQLILHPHQRNRLLGYTLRRRFEVEGTNQAVEFYICSWAMQSCVEKEKTYLNIDDVAHPGMRVSSLNKDRSYLNLMLKQEMINWGLTDAALYVGRLEEDFQYALASGIGWMLRDFSPQRDQTAVITASLGSTIAMDTIGKLVEGSSILNERSPLSKKGGTEHVLRDRLKLMIANENHRVPVYMFANQYALVSGARKTVTTTAAALPAIEPQAKLQQALSRSSGPATQKKLRARFVAFTDPEDLLSHPLNPKRSDVMDIGTVNVYVHNRNIVLLGLLANPLDAHVKYDENKVVMDYVLNGWKP